MTWKSLRIWTMAIIAVALVGALALGGCSGSSNDDSSNDGKSSAPSSSTKPSGGYDETDCMLIAFGEAGVAVDEVMVTREEVTESNGVKTYSIDFYSSTLKYEYAINMETGEIIAADAEPRDDEPVSQARDSFNTAEVLRAVCEKNGIDSEDITITRELFSKSGNQEIYTVEFETATMEYEYSFDVETGELIAADSEPQ